MHRAFKVLAVLALLLGFVSTVNAEVYWQLVGHDPCDPPPGPSGGPTHKDTYAGYDSEQGGRLIGWYIYNCDGSESWVPNEARGDGGSPAEAESRQSVPPVRPEVLRSFTRSIASMQRLAGGEEITISITSEIAPELGSVTRMTINVPAGMLSPRGESPILRMKRPVDLK